MSGKAYARQVIDVYGDLWQYPADALALTTNGQLTGDGACVMGAGCAKQAKERFPQLPHLVGERIREHGNHVYVFEFDGFDRPIITFPVKEHWRDKADLRLIRRSVAELLAIVNFTGWQRVVVPRPGSGLGGRDYDREVRPLLADLWDDRFHVIDFARQ